MWYYIPDYINWLLGYKNPDVSDTVETKEEVQQINVETQTEPEVEIKIEAEQCYVREKRNKHRK